jgi:hypothetical protein
MPLLFAGNTSLTSSRQQKGMMTLSEQRLSWKYYNKRRRRKRGGTSITPLAPPRGGNLLAIQVEKPTFLTMYDTEESMFDNATEHLSLQFRLAYTTPIYSSGLLDDIGHLGNTQYALDILEGNYTFLPDTDKWTAKIVKEAHHTFVLLVNKKIDTTIQPIRE